MYSKCLAGGRRSTDVPVLYLWQLLLLKYVWYLQGGFLRSHVCITVYCAHNLMCFPLLINQIFKKKYHANWQIVSSRMLESLTWFLFSMQIFVLVGTFDVGPVPPALLSLEQAYQEKSGISRIMPPVHASWLYYNCPLLAVLQGSSF